MFIKRSNIWTSFFLSRRRNYKFKHLHVTAIIFNKFMLIQLLWFLIYLHFFNPQKIQLLTVSLKLKGHELVEIK